MTKTTSYIFPELLNIVLTAQDVEDFFGKRLNAGQLANASPLDVEDAWYANEFNRFAVCDECGKLHSRSYESCEEVSEFAKFNKDPRTVWLADR